MIVKRRRDDGKHEAGRGFGHVRCLRNLSKSFIYRYIFLSISNQNYFHLTDKLGTVGTWIRHRLLVSILMGTPPLVAIQVSFSFRCFILSRCLSCNNNVSNFWHFPIFSSKIMLTYLLQVLYSPFVKVSQFMIRKCRSKLLMFLLQLHEPGFYCFAKAKLSKISIF